MNEINRGVWERVNVAAFEWDVGRFDYWDVLCDTRGSSQKLGVTYYTSFNEISPFPRPEKGDAFDALQPQSIWLSNHLGDINLSRTQTSHLRCNWFSETVTRPQALFSQEGLLV